MSVYEREVWLPYGCEPLFDLVADIEGYPAFVPGYREARITRRQGHLLTVFQTVGLGPLRLGFHSAAELHRPERLSVRSLDNPFADLAVEWRFRGGAGACHVHFRAEYRLRDGLPAVVTGRWLDQLNARILEAFAMRAADLLGAPVLATPSAPAEGGGG